MEVNNNVVELTEDEAVKQLKAFVDRADLDDLAQLYSHVLTDLPVRVLGDFGNSDVFKKGERDDEH